MNKSLCRPIHEEGEGVKISESNRPFPSKHMQCCVKELNKILKCENVFNTHIWEQYVFSVQYAFTNIITYIQ